MRSTSRRGHPSSPPSSPPSSSSPPPSSSRVVARGGRRGGCGCGRRAPGLGRARPAPAARARGVPAGVRGVPEWERGVAASWPRAARCGAARCAARAAPCGARAASCAAGAIAARGRRRWPRLRAVVGARLDADGCDGRRRVRAHQRGRDETARQRGQQQQHRAGDHAHDGLVPRCAPHESSMRTLSCGGAAGLTRARTASRAPRRPGPRGRIGLQASVDERGQLGREAWRAARAATAARACSWGSSTSRSLGDVGERVGAQGGGVEHDPEAPDVGGRADRAAARLLGRHVAPRADARPARGRAAARC